LAAATCGATLLLLVAVVGCLVVVVAPPDVHRPVRELLEVSIFF
jgi:hypothetical protein